ncbi:maleylpyruvate isomerase family mycothiol-dependent enzyme [Agrococcus sp. SGAir0287]|uniref:maleylpyruvate isomerase family mycothiol-dependent enzyme n=1 Tax=Agrococcus sp. SGAir0287 TaxID=2070347 RepID=UPI0010CCD83C|nr:maleylpyruvate isomerase family mycothiol-dependent enzyme [Agrococcus sp. SGAir0287]QCR19076.1 maleylpyruvate isomerase family mycothiol-dependent enzyme [Agrococcus sp. SGAir0287]
MTIPPPDLRIHLAREVRAMVALARRADDEDAWDAPVPSCPGWSLRDLVAHVGGIERWVLHALAHGDGDAPAPRVPDDAGLAAWLAGSAQALLEALAVDPATPAWTMAPPRTVGFWIRRQAHEHAIHAWDAAVALGDAPSLDAGLAADGIEEVVGTLWPRQLRLGRVVAPDLGLALVADGGGTWLLGGEAATTLAGDAEALALALWHRIPADDPRLRWSGDVTVGRSVLALPLAP